MSWKNWKNVDWGVKNQIKKTNKQKKNKQYEITHLNYLLSSKNPVFFFAQIFVNGDRFTEYNYRIPLEAITHITMSGIADFFEPEFY